MRTIRFFTTDQTAETSPIIEAHQHKFKWRKKALQEIKNMGAGLEQKQHTLRCPAIREIAGLGYLITAPEDLTIMNKNGRLKAKGVHHHIQEQLPWVADFPQAKMPFTVKLAMPWRVLAPPDVKFLIMQVPYPDSPEFVALSGVYEPRIDWQINIQGYMVTADDVIIKKGTPLAALIPLTQERFKISIGRATELEHEMDTAFNRILMSTRPLSNKEHGKLYDKYYYDMLESSQRPLRHLLRGLFKPKRSSAFR